MKTCCSRRDVNIGTHDGNVMKDQWTHARIKQRPDPERCRTIVLMWRSARIGGGTCA